MYEGLSFACIFLFCLSVPCLLCFRATRPETGDTVVAGGLDIHCVGLAAGQYRYAFSTPCN
jgi:hypothetical protein